MSLRLGGSGRPLAATVAASSLIVVTVGGSAAHATVIIGETVREGARTTSGAATADTNVPPTLTPVDEATLQAALDQWRSDVGPNVTLSVRVPGYDDIHVVSTSGGGGEPISIDDTYGIASVTKTFTAAVALQLVEEGQLSLDEPIERWLPDLPGADQITLDMLLSHTSGLGDQPGSPPIMEPGEAFYYSDVGYAVIGQLIERVLGEDLATVIDERLTGPLALDDTSLSPTTISDPLRAAAAMTSTSQDLLDWGEALYSGDLLGDDATATMLEMRNTWLFAHFGLGAMGFCGDLIGCTPDNVELVGHSGIGGYPGTTTLLVRDRDTGTTVVIRATVPDINVLEAMVPLAYQALPQSSDTQQT